MYSQNSSFTTPKPSESSEIRQKKWFKQWWGKLIVVFVFLLLTLVVAVGFYIFQIVSLLKSGDLAPQSLLGEDFDSQQSLLWESLVSDDDPSFGNPDARVVIVEFADFACLACQQESKVIKEIKRDYSNKIYFIFRDFPITGDPERSFLAAMAGECAHEQGKFWQMHDKLFLNPFSIDLEQTYVYATQIGLNDTQFKNCLLSRKYFEEIEEDTNMAAMAGARGTPTFFINGVKISGAIPLSTFEEIITRALKE